MRISPDRELTADIETVAILDAAAVERMFRLYARYYEGTSEDLFRHDLSGKSHVILLHDATGTLRGFSTVVVSRHRNDTGDVRAVFSGDTVVDDRFWGQQALSRAWLRLTGGLAAAEPDVPLFWFLLTKGHRTYRFLRVFYRTFYPTWERPTPAREQALMDLFATDRFGAAYDAEHGIVRFDRSHGHLAGRWAEIPEKDRGNPDVRYFLTRNPGYVRGDELVCLAELNLGNHRSLTGRIFAQGMAEAT